MYLHKQCVCMYVYLSVAFFFSQTFKALKLRKYTQKRTLFKDVWLHDEKMCVNLLLIDCSAARFCLREELLLFVVPLFTEVSSPLFIALCCSEPFSDFIWIILLSNQRELCKKNEYKEKSIIK